MTLKSLADGLASARGAQLQGVLFFLVCLFVFYAFLVINGFKERNPAPEWICLPIRLLPANYGKGLARSERSINDSRLVPAFENSLSNSVSDPLMGIGDGFSLFPTREWLSYCSAPKSCLTLRSPQTAGRQFPLSSTIISWEFAQIHVH